jgi:integrase/recombinase XerD
LNSRGEKSPRALQKDNFSYRITKKQYDEYISLRELEGLCKKWMKDIKNSLTDYIKFINWYVTKEKTLAYLKNDMNKFSVSTYRKKTYQIRRFLTYLGYEWANHIKLPKEPETIIKHITKEDIVKSLNIFKKHSQSERYTALILLGASSGLRAEEIYQLEIKDLDIYNRIIHVNHDPSNGQTTKTKKSRISFFNEETKEALLKYFSIYDSKQYTHLFTKAQCIDAMKRAPIQVKDLRKFFSQEWDRRGGPTSIKKILMGHSLKGDVDLMHYNYQSEEDLKKIYDKVMNNQKIFSSID